MIPLRRYAGQRVGVFGMGRSGLATARALAAGGATPVCWDDRETGRIAAVEAGFLVEDLTDMHVARGLFKLVLSPGAAHTYPTPHPAVAAALSAGCRIDNDVGLFFEALAELRRAGATRGDRAETAAAGGPGRRVAQSPARVLAITGSNGKSTTAALAHHLLRAAGLDAQLGGNIGRGVLDLDPPEPGSVVVLELSSYQTDVARLLAPDVAVFLNLTADHLDRHGGMGGYFASKAKLFARPDDMVSIVGVDEAEGLWLADRLDEIWRRDRLIRITAREDGLLRRGREVLCAAGRATLLRDGVGSVLADLNGHAHLRGAHNLQNAAAACAAVAAFGVSSERLAVGLATFEGLAHRMKRVGEAGGVVFVNDSKATNADAAEKALASYARVRWIVGGVSKEGGLAAAAARFGAVAKAYLIGASADAFAAELGAAGVAHEACGDMATAVARAAEDAEPGEVVLLSPAAASFDQFKDFEARGDAFETLVRATIAPRDG